uniref:RNA polymerase II-associated factor 1 homolog n=1 Tax=Cacopsylla melanoneura TaxID=428564 RepID=A0A8D8X3D5_9HEMI
MAPTIQTTGTGTPSEKRTPSTHSTPIPPRPAERKSELVCRVKYNNTLPDIPFDCKFIAYPFESTRFIEYKSTSLERNYKYEVLTEHDLGVTIDLINKDTYAPNYNIQLDPADEKLLEEDTLTPQDSKRSRHHARSVSWLRRTEYISTEQTRFQPQTMDKVEAKVGFSIKKNFKEDNLYMDRESQVKAIEKTFADTKLPIEKHYSKPNVVPVEIMPVYPDFKYWKYPCAQVIFDSDPAPQGRPVPAQIEEMSQAMIRGVMDESGEQFVAYFLPTAETLDKRKLDVLNSVEYTDEQEYEYKMAREYNWNVKSKSCKGYEENYFLIVRDDAVYYNELETRVRLSKRRQKVGAAPNNTRLVVAHRPLNATEFRIQRLRERFLEPPNEEEEEEEEEEEDEEMEEEKEEEGKGSGKKMPEDEEEEKKEKKEEAAPPSDDAAAAAKPADESVADSSVAADETLKEGETTMEEDDEVNNLQLAWEMLELARSIYYRVNNELKLADIYLKLSEVSMESENYAAAIEDIEKGLAIYSVKLEKDARPIAEAYYKLGMAHANNDNYPEAVNNFKLSRETLLSRVENLKSSTKPDAELSKEPFYKKENEIKELEALLPEMDARIEECTSDNKEIQKVISKFIAGGRRPAGASDDGAGPSSAPDSAASASSSSSSKPVSDISHLVKKKRKPEEDIEKPEVEGKKIKLDESSATKEKEGAAPATEAKAAAEASDDVEMEETAAPEKTEAATDTKTEDKAPAAAGDETKEAAPASTTD